MCTRFAPVSQLLSQSLAVLQLLERHAEAGHAKEEVTVGLERRLMDEVNQRVAVDRLPHRTTLQRLHPVAGDLPVRADEILQLLDPLSLNVLARGDDDDTGARVEVPDEGHHAKRDVGLAHAHFVGEIGAAVALEHVVERHGALQLALLEAELLHLLIGGIVDQLARELGGDRGVAHDCGSATGVRNISSYQSRNSPDRSSSSGMGG